MHVTYSVYSTKLSRLTYSSYTFCITYSFIYSHYTIHIYTHYTILHYIVTLQYTTVQAVLSDMALMCRNAEQYNGPTSPIVTEAKALYTSLGGYIVYINAV